MPVSDNEKNIELFYVELWDARSCEPKILNHVALQNELSFSLALRNFGRTFSSIIFIAQSCVPQRNIHDSLNDICSFDSQKISLENASDGKNFSDNPSDNTSPEIRNLIGL